MSNFPRQRDHTCIKTLIWQIKRDNYNYFPMQLFYIQNINIVFFLFYFIFFKLGYMSTVSQDNYVMEMQVQQEEWAKQKETYKRGKEWDDRGGGSKKKKKRQNNINICSLSIKYLL